MQSIGRIFGPGHNGTQSRMDRGVVAVVGRFPGKRQAIERLAQSDPTFRSMCEDFADAKAALEKWEASSSPYRNERRAEYEELVNGLLGEIEAALHAKTVVPFAMPPGRSSR